MATQFIILHGEMRDADYLDVFGPFDTREDAQAEADRLVEIGAIIIEPDDQLDYRIMALNDSSQAKPNQAYLDEKEAEDDEVINPALEAQFGATMDAAFDPSNAPTAGAPMSFQELMGGFAGAGQASAWAGADPRTKEEIMAEVSEMTNTMMSIFRGNVPDAAMREVFGEDFPGEDDTIVPREDPDSDASS